MLTWLSAVGGILLTDLVLSGDNALVIGVAAASLPRKQRGVAIILGGIGAIMLRISFAFLATFLLLLPWLQAVGGVLLLIIAIRLLMDRDHHEEKAEDDERPIHIHGKHIRNVESPAAKGFLAALLTILVADTTMSLDNVLAVGALAHGNFLALAIGIFISIALLLIGSSLVATLMKWLPWLLDLAALILAWTSANMLLHDTRLGDILNNYNWTSIAVPAFAIGVVLCADLLFRFRNHRLAHATQSHTHTH
jgi:YjbE family integral membrane protein